MSGRADIAAAGGTVLPRANHLLSRYAECVMWFARYMERIENLARIIDTTEIFMRTGGGVGAWQSIVQINADEERFYARHPRADADLVIDFYVLDRDNPTSIVQMIAAARENARTLRPLISTEMWSHINVFYNRLRALGPADIAAPRVASLCAMLKTECQTHAGITEGTFYRDQAWCFHQLGRNLERADQITRLVDIKYHTLLPPGAPVGSPVDISQWNSVLRAAAGYHAYRRTTSAPLSPASVAGFLLLAAGFPRSLTVCVRQMHWHLTQLRADHDMRACARPLERIDGLNATLAANTIGDILVRGLHEFLERQQQELAGLQEDIAQAFWRHEAAE